MKCIKSKCPNYLESDRFESCYLLDKFLADDECCGEEKILEIKRHLQYVENQLEIVRNNQEKEI